MDEESDVRDLTYPTQATGGTGTVNLENERLDCENLGTCINTIISYRNYTSLTSCDTLAIDDITMRWVDPNRPSFVTVLMRFMGNIFGELARLHKYISNIAY
ncbi:hypothetical protein KR222_000134 [Zaprionus bogoriensis]|nr:hypothetical protein KR222_000134 [Zaprionus bogoriensis]